MLVYCFFLIEFFSLISLSFLKTVFGRSYRKIIVVLWRRHGSRFTFPEVRTAVFTREGAVASSGPCRLPLGDQCTSSAPRGFRVSDPLRARPLPVPAPSRGGIPTLGCRPLTLRCTRRVPTPPSVSSLLPLLAHSCGPILWVRSLCLCPNLLSPPPGTHRELPIGWVCVGEVRGASGPAGGPAGRTCLADP